MKKNKKILSLKKIIFILIIILLILIVTLVILLKNRNTSINDENTDKVETEQQKLEKQFLQTRNEKERMQIYLAKYFNYLENKEYEKAYNLLYEDFKNLYYPTFSFYKKYVEETYFVAMEIEYEDIQRQGEYYIITVELINMLDTINTKVQKFVIYEKGANDFVLSFQAE